MQARTLLLIAVLATVGCGSKSDAGGETAAEPANYESTYRQGKEARAWMGTGKNHMFEASDETCNEVIADLYRLGAEEVRVVDGDKLDENSEGEIAATLMARLPADEAKRKALFDYEKENTEDADPDTKRDYVEIVFD